MRTLVPALEGFGSCGSFAAGQRISASPNEPAAPTAPPTSWGGSAFLERTYRAASHRRARFVLDIRARCAYVVASDLRSLLVDRAAKIDGSDRPRLPEYVASGAETGASSELNARGGNDSGGSPLRSAGSWAELPPRWAMCGTGSAIPDVRLSRRPSAEPMGYGAKDAQVWMSAVPPVPPGPVPAMSGTPGPPGLYPGPGRRLARGRAWIFGSGAGLTRYVRIRGGMTALAPQDALSHGRNWGEISLDGRACGPPDAAARPNRKMQDCGGADPPAPQERSWHITC